MNIGVLGTGIVGKTVAATLAEAGHDVVVGTRDPGETLARAESDRLGNPPFRVWREENPDVRLGTFAEAAAHGEIVINATAGAASLDALELTGEENLEGKILIDVANPLTFSSGMLSLVVSNTDSLAEQIQRAFPRTKVVKALNTVNAQIMVNPRGLADGDHHVFVSGDDKDSRDRVADFLREWFGWRNVLDLGDLTSARGAEMVLLIWVRLMSVLETPMFNFKVVTQDPHDGG